MTPIFRLKTQIPFAALTNIDKEIERLEKFGVNEKNVYSPWGSPTVYIKKKDNKIRVYVHYSTGLNDCLEQSNFLLPSADGIFAQLNGCRIISKLDVSEVYQQIPVDKKYAKY